MGALLARGAGDQPVLVLAGDHVFGVVTPAEPAGAVRRAALRARAPVG